jgi:hypothetical protein
MDEVVSEVVAQALDNSFGEKLRASTTGCRLEIGSFRSTRAIKGENQALLLSTFRADEGSVRGTKEVFRKDHPLVKPILAASRLAGSTWKQFTVPYEDGVRLIRTDRVLWMQERITDLQWQSDLAWSKLSNDWQSVVDEARDRLGILFDSSDYARPPARVHLNLSFPSLNPDARLESLVPEVYESERRKIAAKFQEAAEVSEQILLNEFAQMIEHLRERLTPDVDGKPKIMKASTVDGLIEFAQKFRECSIGSNSQLDALVDRARALAERTDLKRVRKYDEARQQMVGEISSLASEVEILVGPSRRFEL